MLLRDVSSGDLIQREALLQFSLGEVKFGQQRGNLRLPPLIFWPTAMPAAGLLRPTRWFASMALASGIPIIATCETLYYKSVIRYLIESSNIVVSIFTCGIVISDRHQSKVPSASMARFCLMPSP
jgi:hypothetical protein